MKFFENCDYSLAICPNFYFFSILEENTAPCELISARLIQFIIFVFRERKREREALYDEKKKFSSTFVYE